MLPLRRRAHARSRACPPCVGAPSHARTTTVHGNTVGPLWIGPLSNVAFVRRALAAARRAEARAESAAAPPPTALVGGSDASKQDAPTAPKAAPKAASKAASKGSALYEAREARLTLERSAEDAPGLPLWSRHTGTASPAKLVAVLRERGASAARSAFDPMRVRTDAPLTLLTHILTELGVASASPYKAT